MRGRPNKAEDGKTHAVLLLLDLNDGTVLEGPLDDVGLLLRLDCLAALQGGPEVLEVLDCCVRSAIRFTKEMRRRESRQPSAGEG